MMTSKMFNLVMLKHVSAVFRKSFFLIQVEKFRTESTGALLQRFFLRSLPFITSFVGRSF